MASVIWMRPAPFLPLAEGVVTRTRTLGLRSASASEVPVLWSEYSMNSDVCLLGLLRVLIVTGVPSSGSEYADFSSPGPDTSVGVVSRSLGLVESSVGAGSGGALLELIPIVAFSRGREECGGWQGTARASPTQPSAQEGTFLAGSGVVLGNGRVWPFVLDWSPVEEAVKGRTKERRGREESGRWLG